MNAELDAGNINAECAILYNPDNGEILYSKRADQRKPIASLTKIMTLLAVDDEIKYGHTELSDTVTVSNTAVSAIGTGIYLKEGDTLSVYDCIKAIILPSANNASVALAEHIAQTENSFVDMMNVKAKQMELRNSNFKCCHGLDTDGNYSSAYDIALLSAQLLKINYMAPILKMKSATIQNGKQTIKNTNILLEKYEDIIGIKTGTTTNAGNCFSAAGKKNGVTLIAVILGCPTTNDRFITARKLIDYGYNAYEKAFGYKLFTRLLILRGQLVPKIIENEQIFFTDYNSLKYL